MLLTLLQIKIQLKLVKIHNYKARNTTEAGEANCLTQTECSVKIIFCGVPEVILMLGVQISNPFCSYLHHCPPLHSQALTTSV